MLYIPALPFLQFNILFLCKKANLHKRSTSTARTRARALHRTFHCCRTSHPLLAMAAVGCTARPVPPTRPHVSRPLARSPLTPTTCSTAAVTHPPTTSFPTATTRAASATRSAVEEEEAKAMLPIWVLERLESSRNSW